MFTLLLLPPVCGLFLFLGLLTAPRRFPVRVALTLTLTGLVAPVVGLALWRNLLPDVAVELVLGGSALLVATLLWRLTPRLPYPRTHLRLLCWLLVLGSCTLITVVLTAAGSSPLVNLPLLLRVSLAALPLLGAHALLKRPVAPGAGRPASQPRPAGPRAPQPPPPLLNRPLELVGADAPYYPLAAGFTAGIGPAAAFSRN